MAELTSQRNVAMLLTEPDANQKKTTPKGKTTAIITGLSSLIAIISGGLIFQSWALTHQTNPSSSGAHSATAVPTSSYATPISSRGGRGDRDDYAGQETVSPDYESLPTLPDPDASAPSMVFAGTCQYPTYVQCYYAGQLLRIDNSIEVDPEELEQLEVAIYFDIQNNERVEGWDDASRALFDTPFWNGGQEGDYFCLPGQACIDGQCYERYEVNYLAQGMWSAASGQSLFESEVIVWSWKFTQYFEFVLSEGTIYWNEYGYNRYFELDAMRDELYAEYGR